MLIFNKINVQTIAYFGRLKMEADIWVQWINAVRTETKNKKKQPFSDASASYLSLVLWHV